MLSSADISSPGKQERIQEGVVETQVSRAHTAYLVLEGKIVTLELRPGSSITEKQLIELVGLGRTPVREAIQRLSWEGLIEVVPRSGVKIADIRPEDYSRVMEPRVALEPLLARKAARFADAMHRARLAECADSMMAAAKARDMAGFLQADKDFDETLDRACENPFLTKVLAPLQTHARRFWVRFSAEGGPEASAMRHVKVMKAIQVQDEEAAGLAMAELMDYLSSIAASLMR
ncbi:GntR family transcriptional regulator [Kaustia mangrovi]|uniref:GntR family transcriptional regulator n=1 Tax=Kaustia mangrovi TaxID=2593653 RepID=A0A7S8C6I2_9HYPH|nr:GntR family transcriptional regulator [Kaustia mangrovi]